MSTGIPVISTTVLNWNRSDLLRRTLESYRATTTIPFELIIVDNASSDDSRAVIEAFCASESRARALFLDQNGGGTSINLGLEQSRGRLLHISENDLEYRTGWCDRILAAFEAFPRLGQLSLFSPFPTDAEVWEPKPVTLRHSGGCLVYEAAGNVGTSSVLRREVWDGGVRLQTLPSEGSFRFPADVALSEDIKRAGFMVAWADRYLVANLGHSHEDMTSRPEYYRENYRSKDWLGESGWQQRMLNWRRQPKPVRASFLASDDPITSEQASPADGRDRRLWSMFDTETPEVEVLEFLYALVRLVKPALVLETRAWMGHAAAAIGRALRENATGRLIAVEREARTAAADRVRGAGVEDLVEIVSDLPLAGVARPNLVLMDSEPARQSEDFTRISSLLAEGALVVVHGKALEAMADDLEWTTVPLPTPRGLTIQQKRAVPAERRILDRASGWLRRFRKQ